jgi:broad specificity phosphatase PhoE
MSGRTSELIVVRHGQSTWNVQHRFTGQADPPLSDLGRSQAVDLARSVAALSPDAVVTSDLARAYETGAIVAEHLGLTEPARLEALRERWSDALTGLAADDIEIAFPGQLAAWREARAITVPGNHEPFDAFARRVTRGLVDAGGYGDRVLVVAHAGIFVVLGSLDGAGSQTEVANAEGRVVTVVDGRVLDVGPPIETRTGVTRTGMQDP